MNPPSLWKEELSCDEEQLLTVARELGRELRQGSGHWVLLEGPMGAGKSTFARGLIQGMGIVLPPEGSPTFAIAHEYENPSGVPLVHLDLYRLENEDELDASGIPAFFWEAPGAIVVAEWTSRFPALKEALETDLRYNRWKVELDFTKKATLRELRVWRL